MCALPAGRTLGIHVATGAAKITVVALCTSLVVQQRACERPQIVAGDFNAPYCGAPELQLLRDAGFVDALGLAGDTEPTPWKVR